MSTVRAIEHRLSDLLGLKPRSGSTAQLERALREVNEERGLLPEEVAVRLERDPWLVRRLAGALTVDETFFLRHPEHFEALTGHVRERLASDDRRLVLWSAGCAGGEEPYSMAIVIHRALGEPALSRTQILASDVSEAALRRAKQGVYSPWSFRGATQLCRSGYFAARPSNDAFQLRPPVHGAVELQHRSVEQQLAELAPASLDVVFFRNVAIYLTDDALRRVYAGLHRALRDDGMLLLAPADPRPPSELFVSAQIRDVLVYRKHGAPAAAGPRLSQPAGVRRSAQPTMSPPRAARATHDDRSLAALAQQLADRGALDEALSVLDGRLALGPASGELLALRGRVQLAAGRAEASERDLRAAVLQRPEHVLWRFDRALALEALQQREDCRRELLHMLSQLEARADSEQLDEATCVKSLRQAARELLRRME